MRVPHCAPGLERAREEARGDKCLSQLGSMQLSTTDIFITAARLFEAGIVLWQLVLVLDVLAIVRNPFKPDRHTGKCTLFVLVGTGAVGVLTILLLERLQVKYDPDSPDYIDRCAGGVIHQPLPAFWTLIAVQAIVLLVVAVVAWLLYVRLRHGLTISQVPRGAREGG